MAPSLSTLAAAAQEILDSAVAAAAAEHARRMERFSALVASGRADFARSLASLPSDVNSGSRRGCDPEGSSASLEALLARARAALAPHPVPEPRVDAERLAALEAKLAAAEARIAALTAGPGAPAEAPSERPPVWLPRDTERSAVSAHRAPLVAADGGLALAGDVDVTAAAHAAAARAEAAVRRAGPIVEALYAAAPVAASLAPPPPAEPVALGDLGLEALSQRLEALAARRRALMAEPITASEPAILPPRSPPRITHPPALTALQPSVTGSLVLQPRSPRGSPTPAARARAMAMEAAVREAVRPLSPAPRPRFVPRGLP